MTSNEKSLSVAVFVLSVAVVTLVAYVIFHDQKVCRAQAVQIVDDAGNQRAIIGMSPEGHVGIALSDKSGRIRTSIGLLPDGKPVMTMQDGKGNVVWGAQEATSQANKVGDKSLATGQAEVRRRTP